MKLLPLLLLLTACAEPPVASPPIVGTLTPRVFCLIVRDTGSLGGPIGPLTITVDSVLWIAYPGAAIPNASTCDARGCPSGYFARHLSVGREVRTILQDPGRTWGSFRLQFNGVKLVGGILHNPLGGVDAVVLLPQPVPEKASLVWTIWPAAKPLIGVTFATDQPVIDLGRNCP